MVLVVDMNFKRPQWLWNKVYTHFRSLHRHCFTFATRYSEMEPWDTESGYVTDGILIKAEGKYSGLIDWATLMRKDDER